ncbi:hypothetical protein BJ165DRAFT_1484441 [Panaeolus papilionaceus]|nr:hypothetical protein BJ165DRAFT_1484441 [Panaeolus papilionaceus]
MSSGLGSSYGVWLVSLFLETILYGCGLLQAWLYFHWYQKDHRGIRAMVLLLVLLETLQIAFIFTSTYLCLITHFGDFAYLMKINWADSAQLPLTYLSAFVVQIYFSSCIYKLNRNAKLLPALIVALAVTQLGAGIAQDVVITRLGTFEQLQETAPTYALQSAATLACDLLITGSLLLRLNSSRSGLKATNSMLDRLMINAVNRGGLTALAAALNLILYVSRPNTLWFLIGLFLSSKLYMNSCLASLNSRNHIRSKFSNLTITDTDWRAMESIREPQHPPECAVAITIQSETHTEEEVKRPQLVDRMV